MASKKKDMHGVRVTAFIAGHISEAKSSAPKRPLNIQDTKLQVYSLERRAEVWYVHTSVGERKLHVYEGKLYFMADPDRGTRSMGQKGESRAIIFAQA